MSARKPKRPVRTKAKPAPKARKPVRGGSKKAAARRRAPVAPPNPLVGKKTQATPDWIDVTIHRWHGFFRGVMMEVFSNYTRGSVEVCIAGRGIGEFPTIDAAKAAAVAAVLKLQEGP